MFINISKIAALAAVLVSVAVPVRADGNDPVPAQIDALTRQIQAKIDAGKKNEADFAEELTGFDKLIAAQDSGRTNDIAAALFQKGVVYLEVLNDTEKSKVLFLKVSKDYPGFKLAGEAGRMASEIQQQEEARRIREALTPGTVFPDFTVKDMAGKSLSVSNYAGKVVLVDFWATWCLPCMIELPSVVKYYKADHDQGLEVVGVCLNKTEEKDQLTMFFKRNPEVNWPQYFEGHTWDNTLAMKYGVQQIPSNILVGRDGKIAGADLHGDDLKQAISKALAGK